MSFEFVILLALGAVAGGFINGLAGFGTALFALGFWLQIMSPIQAVFIVLAMSILSGIQGLIIVAHAINWPRLMRFLLPGLIGIPIGVKLLALVDPTHLKLVIALFLIIYGGFFTFRKGLPSITRRTPVIDGSIGFAGGVLGGMAGLSGALPTMWCALRPWAKAETRALLQPYNIAIQVIALALVILGGSVTRETLTYTAIATPFTFAAAQVGLMLFKCLTDTQFRTLLIVMLFLSGIILMLRELL